jgi:amino acid transporter
MVWGVSLYHSRWPGLSLEGLQWAVASFFILSIGMSMAELASAAPTSGGVSDA